MRINVVVTQEELDSFVAAAEVCEYNKLTERVIIMKLKFKASTQDWALFASFAVILLYIVAIGFKY
jgi:hypothetical protein